VTEIQADAGSDRFSLVVGGPFSTLLRWLCLTGPDQLPTWRAATALAIAAWLPPALLAIAQSLADPRYSGLGYFSDGMAYTRYLIAIWFLVATERYGDNRLILLAQHFRAAGLLSDDDLPRFRHALGIADRRSASAVAELVILAAALLWSGLMADLTVELARSSWQGALMGDQVTLSWAGSLTRFFSTPLFMFLVLRWIWRFLVWTALLYRLSRLPLRLMPLHPDRAAGLGFLSIYPSIFSGFIFALSSVVAASMITDLALQRHDPDTVWLALALWLAFSMLLILGPLLVFVHPIYTVRERALLEYGRLANQHHLEFHRKWIEDGGRNEDILGSEDVSSAADINAAVETVQKLRFLPVDFAAVLQLFVATGAPLLAVVLSQIPLQSLLQWFAGSVL